MIHLPKAIWWTILPYLAGRIRDIGRCQCVSRHLRDCFQSALRNVSLARALAGTPAVHAAFIYGENKDERGPYAEWISMCRRVHETRRREIETYKRNNGKNASRFQMQGMINDDLNIEIDVDHWDRLEINFYAYRTKHRIPTIFARPTITQCLDLIAEYACRLNDNEWQWLECTKQILLRTGLQVFRPQVSLMETVPSSDGSKTAIATIMFESPAWEWNAWDAAEPAQLDLVASWATLPWISRSG